MIKDSENGQTYYCSHTTIPGKICDECLGKPIKEGRKHPFPNYVSEEEILSQVFPIKEECDCGCHTSESSSEEMKRDGCDLCYELYPHPIKEEKDWEKGLRIDFNSDETANWWIEKINSLLQKERESWEKILEKKQTRRWESYNAINHDNAIKALEAEREKIENLIVDEILICRKEGTPTSRLTSLAMKIKQLNKKQ